MSDTEAPRFMLKAIIFDCWSTLFFTDTEPSPFARLADRLSVNKDLAFEKILEKNIMLQKATDLLAMIKGVLLELKINPEQSLVKEAVAILVGWGSKPYPQTLDVLWRLKKDYKLGLISNAFAPAFEKIKKQYGLVKIFDEIVASYEVGLLKPDSRIFQLALERLAVKPEEALMVGDNPIDDLGGAAYVGIKGLMLDNKNKYPDYQPRISDISQIFNRLKDGGFI